MQGEPLVSVLMPARNAGLYIREAIESVISQRGAEREVVVVDDGSTDDTAEIAASFGDPVRLERQEALGESAARNRCAALARGSHVAFLDADDVWPPGKLELQLPALADDVQLVFGHQLQFRSPELGPEVPEFAGEDKVVPSLLAGAMLVTRSDFDRVGGYNDYVIAPTMDWLLRARELGYREMMLPEVVLHRRLHPMGHSRLNRDSYGDYARILKASLDRRRRAK